MIRTTLRQIVNIGLEEALKEEDLILKIELEQLTEYILNNSKIELTEEGIYMGNGNRLGVGEENKDKKLILPRFLLFKFKKRNIQDTQDSWSWSLQSYTDLEDLEGRLQLRGFEDAKCIAIIDNKIFKYERECVEKHNSFYFPERVIRWEREMYSVTYENESILTEERFRSKKDLEKYILELLTKNTENIEVRNLVEDKTLGFSVSAEETLYDSNDVDIEREKEKWLEWQEQDEEEFWNDDFGDFDF